MRAPRRAFTLVEALVAGSILLVVVTVMWPLVRQGTAAQSRMADVMKTLDAATLQARLDEDLRTSIEVREPPAIGAGLTLSFFNREYDKVTYVFRPAPDGTTYDLVRESGTGPRTEVLARDVKRGLFFRTGHRLVGYHFEFDPSPRPGSTDGSASPLRSLRSEVYVENGIY